MTTDNTEDTGVENTAETATKEVSSNWAMMAKGALNIVAQQASGVADKALSSDFAKNAMTQTEEARATAKESVNNIGKTVIDVTAKTIYVVTKDGQSTVKGKFDQAKQTVTDATDAVTGVAEKIKARVAEIDEQKNPKKKSFWSNPFGKSK